MPPRKDKDNKDNKGNKGNKAPPGPPQNAAAASSSEAPSGDPYLDSLTPEERAEELRKRDIREQKALEQQRRQEREMWNREEAAKEARRAAVQQQQRERQDEAYIKNLHKRAANEGVLPAEYYPDEKYWLELPDQKGTWKEVQGDWWCPHCDAHLNDNVLGGHLDGQQHKKKMAWARGETGASSSTNPTTSSSGAAAPAKAAAASSAAASASGAPSAAYPEPPQPWLCWRVQPDFGAGKFLWCILCSKWVQDEVPRAGLHSYCGVHGFPGDENQKDHKRKLNNLDSYREWLQNERRSLGLPPTPTVGKAAGPPPTGPAAGPAATGPPPGGAAAAAAPSAAAPPPGARSKAAPDQPWLAWQQADGEWGVRCIMCKKWATDFYGDEVALKSYCGSHGFSGGDNQKDHARKIQNWRENSEMLRWLVQERRPFHPEPAARPAPPLVRPGPRPSPGSGSSSAGSAWGKAPGSSAAQSPPAVPFEPADRPTSSNGTGPPGPPPKFGSGGSASASFSKAKGKAAPPQKPQRPPLPKFPIRAEPGQEPPAHQWLAWVEADDGHYYLFCLGCEEFVSEEDPPKNLKRYRGSHGMEGECNCEAHARFHTRFNTDRDFEHEMETRAQHRGRVPEGGGGSRGDPEPDEEDKGEEDDDDDDGLEEC